MDVLKMPILTSAEIIRGQMADLKLPKNETTALLSSHDYYNLNSVCKVNIAAIILSALDLSYPN